LGTVEELGMRVTHLYGLTETYGPIAVCAWQPAWDDLPAAERMELRSHQGVGTVLSEVIRIVDPTGADVPADGATVGEIVMQGNNVAVGYYRDDETTASIEVEHALAGHPDLVEVAVVSVPDELWGEVAMVYAVPREGAAPTLAELREHAGGRLARHKLPKAMELVDALPKTATGKVQKHVLRERARESATPGV